MSGFDDRSRLIDIGKGLYAAIGYNMHRDANRARADDQKVRTLVSTLLADARRAVSDAESGYRRDRLGPPSRAHPFPDPAAVADAQRLEALAAAIGALEGQVRHAPVPGTDRQTERYRDESETLVALIEQDRLLAGRAETLRALVAGKVAEEMLLAAREIDTGIAAIGETLAARRIMLT